MLGRECVRFSSVGDPPTSRAGRRVMRRRRIVRRRVLRRVSVASEADPGTYGRVEWGEDGLAFLRGRTSWPPTRRRRVPPTMPDLFLDLRDSAGGRGSTPPPLSEQEALCLLREADFSAVKLIPWGSNYSFAAALETADGRER